MDLVSNFLLLLTNPGASNNLLLQADLVSNFMLRAGVVSGFFLRVGDVSSFNATNNNDNNINNDDNSINDRIDLSIASNLRSKAKYLIRSNNRK